MSLLPPSRPDGDADRLRAAATAWSDVARDLRDLAPTLDAAVAQLDWRGTAAETFRSGWSPFRNSLAEGTGSYEAQQQALTRIADRVSEAQHRWDLAIAGLVVAGAVGIGLAVFTLGSSLVAGAGETAAATGLMLAVAEGLAEYLGVEVATMSAAITVATTLGARWTALFASQVGSQVAYSTVTRGDINPLDADLGASALSAAVLTAVPAAMGRLAATSGVTVPRLALRYGEGVVMDATLQRLLGHGDLSWPESFTIGGGLNTILGGRVESGKQTVRAVTGRSATIDRRDG